MRLTIEPKRPEGNEDFAGGMFPPINPTNEHTVSNSWKDKLQFNTFTNISLNDTGGVEPGTNPHQDPTQASKVSLFSPLIGRDKNMTF